MKSLHKVIIKANFTQNDQPFVLPTEFSIERDLIAAVPEEPQEELSSEAIEEKTLSERIVEHKERLMELEHAIKTQEAMLAQIENEIKNKTSTKEVLLADAKKESDEIILQAKLQAGEIIMQAGNQSEVVIKEFEVKGFEQGKQDGFSQGHKEGFEQGKQESYEEGFKLGLEEGQTQGVMQSQEAMQEQMQQAIAKAAQIEADAQSRAEEIISGCSEKVKNTVIAVCNKVLQREFLQNNEAILSVVEAALRKVSNQAQIKISVAPDRKLIVEQHLPQLKQILEGQSSVSVFADPSLEIGDVLLETNNGIVDARLEMQLSIIRMCIEEIFSNV